jgi:excisionase family DNA binding protein
MLDRYVNVGVGFHSMCPKLCTTREAAAAVGITRATVQAWIAKKKIRAPKPTVFGNVTVRMWTEADVKSLRLAKEKLYRKGRGRPKPKR